jgi:hypothetical protein
MPDVSVSNKDWDILEDLTDALTAAAISGSPVFEAVAVSTSNEQATETRLTHSPMAVVRYVQTSEQWLPDDVLGCVLHCRILLAAKAATEPARLEECLRLKDAAMNAIETEAPADATAWGEAHGPYHRKLQWGPPEIDTRLREPWGLCVLGLDVGFTVAGHTAR